MNCAPQEEAELSKTEALFRKLVTPPITLRKLILQAKADFWAKEVQTGYTYTYVWMANQFGHFNLGFLPTIGIVALLSGVSGLISPSAPGAAFWIDWTTPWLGPLLVFSFWAKKEIGDVRKCVSNTRGLVFADQLDRPHVWLDAWTALLFFGLGAAVAALGLVWVWGGVFSFLVGLLPAFLAARYWLERRLYFQQSGVPFVYRLALFPGRFNSTAERDAVIGFRRGTLHHLIIAGAEGVGKTTLCVALGTELAFDRKLVRLIPMIKLLDYVTKEPPLQQGHLLWPWRTATWIVVDDVGVDVRAGAGRSDVVPDPALVLRALEAAAPELRNKRTVWALGATGSGGAAWIAGIETFLRRNDPSVKVGRAELVGQLRQHSRSKS